MTTFLPVTIKTALNLDLDLLKFFQGRISVFLAGTTGVGKSSFRLALKRSSLEVIQNTTRTTGDDSELIQYQVSSNTRTTLPLMCYDLGGDEMYRDYRNGRLLEVYPLGMIFFLDHRNHRKQIREALASEGITRKNVARYYYKHSEELGRIDPQRVLEHKKYLEELISLLKINPKLGEYCRIIVPVVNKYDMWRDYHSIEDFQDLFKERFLQLSETGPRVTSFTACSTYEYFGVKEAMDELVRNAGREWRILGIRLRWKKSFTR
jgi:GTPase SAR1 family protein